MPSAKLPETPIGGPGQEGVDRASTVGVKGVNERKAMPVTHKGGVAAIPRFNKEIRHSPFWEDAKLGSYHAAEKLVNQFWSQEHTRQLQERLVPEKEIVFLAVPSSTRKNKIPEALAQKLAKECHGKYIKANKLFRVESIVPVRRIPSGQRILDTRTYTSLEPAARAALRSKQVVVTEDIVSSGTSLKQFVAELCRQGISVQTHAQMMGTVNLYASPDVLKKLQVALSKAGAPKSITSSRMAESYTEKELKKIIGRLETAPPTMNNVLISAILKRIREMPGSSS